MQKEIITPHPLLDKRGRLIEAGYAKSLLLDYDRDAIKAPGLRIKEWDYYLIMNKRFAVALTIADNSYMGLDSISLIDFEVPCEHTASPMQFMTRGHKALPSSSEKGDVESEGKGYKLRFENHGDFRVLSFHMENFLDGKPIDGEIKLKCPEQDSMVIVTPFPKKRKAFYYNQKINCMPAGGSVFFDGRDYIFDPTESFGVLDWGRGVWTYENTWYWSSASGLYNRVPFGFNLGYGFGDTSAASENMLFYDGFAHKLEGIEFHIPQCAEGDDFMSDWHFTSDNGRFDMNFHPIIDRASKTDVGIICSDQHQVFGLFTGTAVLDDGKIIYVTDFPGFAEKVFNKW